MTARVNGKRGGKCAKCGKHLKRSVTGMCRRHAARAAVEREDVKANRRAAIERVMARPDWHEKVAVRAAGASRSRLSWCPIEYRDLYRSIAYQNGMRAPEARRMIEELIEVDTSRYVRTGQLQRTAGECAHR